MNRRLALCLSFLFLPSFCTGQKMHACQFSGISFIDHSDGISTERVSIIEKKKKIDATIFIPDSSGPLPAIVFTHSAIHGPYSDTDLLHFARALARAGAASIILDGTIEWLTPNDDSIRPTVFRFCAGQWLFQHVNLDLHRLANAGNFKVGWIPNGLSQCGIDDSGKAQCWPGGFGDGFGQTSPAELRNTNSFLRPEGVLFHARSLQKQLKLKELDPAWFADVTTDQPGSGQQISPQQERQGTSD